jgi:tRNA A-37 threonylcarbamoyl transferase component Bud32
MKVISANPEDQAFVAEVSRQMLSICLREPSGWPGSNFPGFRTLNRGGRAGVAVVDFAGRCCCVKLFYDSRLFIRWRNRLGFSKAARAYQKGLELNARGVNCPAMIGYAVDRKSGLAILITEFASDAERIDHRIKRGGVDTAVAAALGRFIRQMHDAGVIHKDLSPRNLLVRETDRNYEFLLLDYEDARFFRAVSESMQLDNLHHLHERTFTTVSEEIRREFLAAYLGEKGGVEEWCGRLKKMIVDRPSKYTQVFDRQGDNDV